MRLVLAPFLPPHHKFVHLFADSKNKSAEIALPNMTDLQNLLLIPHSDDVSKVATA